MSQEFLGPTVIKCNEEWQKGFLLAFFDDCTNPDRIDDDWPYAKFRSFRQFTFYEDPTGADDKEPENLYGFEEFFGDTIGAARMVREYRKQHEDDRPDE
jgi:hypothetical protein